MKIIDILIKTINNEETPDKFIYEQNIFTKENNGGYTDEEGDNLLALIFSDYSNLNDEVEIIEDDKEGNKIKKLNNILRINDLKPPYDENLEMIWKNIIIQQNKINEIIDKLEELK